LAEKNQEYRPNVAAVILSSKYPEECKIFIAERSDIDGAWQFPQGGIDSGETPKEALFRELEEEIGTNNIEIITEYPKWIKYDFPPHAVAKMYPFSGQKQKYFLVRLKDEKDINLDTKIPEFIQYKFVDAKDLFNYVSSFKKTIYQKVINYFKKLGYL